MKRGYTPAFIGNNGTGKSSLIEVPPHIEHVKEDLLELMDNQSPYSKAAECYIRCFRDSIWIEQLLFKKG